MTGGERGTARDGFTLVEVLVAFAVLAAFAVVIQAGVIQSADGIRRAQTRMAAELVARSLMAESARTDATALAPDAGTMSGFDWTVRYEPIAGKVATPRKPAKWAPVRMIVGVSLGGRALLSVETVRLLPAASS